MALVDYSDSEDDGNSRDAPQISKSGDHGRKDSNPTLTLPPLPSKFHDLYAVNARVSTRDDPSLHDGRKRSTPHVVGNWPSHLYIEWYPTPTESTKLSSLIASLQAQIPNITSSLTSNLGAALPLHVSLSRSIGLLTAEKDAFLETVTKLTTSSNIRPFQVNFTSIDWVPNFENTRWFLVIRLEKPQGNELNKLLGICNETSEQYGKPPLYPHHPNPEISPPIKRMKLDNSYQSALHRRKDQTPTPAADEKFHVSIAWTLTPPDQKIRNITKAVEESKLVDLRSMHIGVKDMKIKIGNIVTSAALPEKVKVEMGVFG